MLSCINHHVSIVRLRVTAQYLDFIARGGGGSGDSITNPDPAWHALPMVRSRWFDLFDPADRIQAMRGVWGVMGSLMRDVEREEREEEREREKGRGRA